MRKLCAIGGRISGDLPKFGHFGDRHRAGHWPSSGKRPQDDGDVGHTAPKCESRLDPLLRGLALVLESFKSAGVLHFS